LVGCPGPGGDGGKFFFWGGGALPGGVRGEGGLGRVFFFFGVLCPARNWGKFSAPPTLLLTWTPPRLADYDESRFLITMPRAHLLALVLA
jgi:hypothetical protein